MKQQQKIATIDINNLILISDGTDFSCLFVLFFVSSNLNVKDFWTCDILVNGVHFVLQHCFHVLLILDVNIYEFHTTERGASNMIGGIFFFVLSKILFCFDFDFDLCIFLKLFSGLE